MLIAVMAFSTLVLSRASHSNNWAVILSTSKYWFNYRHSANALSIYHILKENGIPDSQIILMLPEDTACDRRNVFPASIFNENGGANLVSDQIEVDYRGDEVTVENFIRVLTGRHHRHTPMSKRLNTDGSSNILVYMTGHGGENFLKFRDKEEIQSQDLADAIKQMEIQGRFNEILLVTDTCEAFSLYKSLYSANVIAVASSDVGESSYSYGYDTNIGNTLIDRFTHFTLKFFQRRGSIKQKIARYVGSLTLSLSSCAIRICAPRPKSPCTLWTGN
ncbi:Nitrogen permease regulator-like 2, variant 2 [Bonamia ostreae]|uniref:Nitrogen permease regulator-like 2, variant 2 n=1 Tax=Bonamia ostreae TaxID=126728 RepID=A0ABV2AIT3_9EUKA